MGARNLPSHMWYVPSSLFSASKDDTHEEGQQLCLHARTSIATFTSSPRNAGRGQSVYKGLTAFRKVIAGLEAAEWSSDTPRRSPRRRHATLQTRVGGHVPLGGGGTLRGCNRAGREIQGPQVRHRRPPPLSAGGHDSPWIRRGTQGIPTGTGGLVGDVQPQDQRGATPGDGAARWWGDVYP